MLKETTQISHVESRPFVQVLKAPTYPRRHMHGKSILGMYPGTPLKEVAFGLSHRWGGRVRLRFVLSHSVWISSHMPTSIFNFSNVIVKYLDGGTQIRLVLSPAIPLPSSLPSSSSSSSPPPLSHTSD